MGGDAEMRSDSERARRAAGEAFGVEPVRRSPFSAEAEKGARAMLWLERMWRGDPNVATPQRVTRAVGIGTAITLLLASRSALGLPGTLEGRLIAGTVATAVLVGPGWTLERWYRARRRREQERLLPPPD